MALHVCGGICLQRSNCAFSQDRQLLLFCHASSLNPARLLLKHASTAGFYF